MLNPDAISLFFHLLLFTSKIQTQYICYWNLGRICYHFSKLTTRAQYGDKIRRGIAGAIILCCAKNICHFYKNGPRIELYIYYMYELDVGKIYQKS